MVNVILCFCVITWQLISTGSAKQFCACIRLNGDKLDVLYCNQCDDQEPPELDDYRRYTDNLVHAPPRSSEHRPPRPPGNAYQGPLGYPANNADSLVNAVKKTIEKRAIFPRRRNSKPGSCHVNDQFVFKSGGDLCRLLSDSITDQGKSNTSRESQSANKPDSDKRRSTGSRDNGGSDGVSAGVVVAISIICFILGLLTMWIVMRFCLEGVIQRLRHGRNSYKTAPPVPNVQDSASNTTTAEPINATRMSALPSNEPNRTSYEGLRPENRTSSVYNAIDPDYQSTGQNSAAPATQGSNEYFILEKDNSDSAEITLPDNKIDNNANPAHAHPEYFVLEKSAGVCPCSNSTTELNGNKDSGSSSGQHTYFILEQQNCASGGSASEGHGVHQSDETNAYFIQEKDTNVSIENQ